MDERELICQDWDASDHGKTEIPLQETRNKKHLSRVAPDIQCIPNVFDYGVLIKASKTKQNSLNRLWRDACYITT